MFCIQTLRTSRWAAAMTGGALALALTLSGPAGAQDTQPGGDGASDGLPDLKPIMQTLTGIRGLEFKSDVPAEKQSLEAFGQYIDQQLNEYFPEDRRDGILQGLVRLGLLKEEIDLTGEFRNALLTQAGAYYDPVDEKFYYLMTDVPAMFIKIMAAHELVHALQDQHFDLDRMMEQLAAHKPDQPRNDDRILAMRFLIEGEATYAMTLYQMKTMMNQDLHANPQQERAVFRMQANMSKDRLIQMTKAQMGMLGQDNAMADAIKAMDKIPPYILEPLMAAYLKGAYFVVHLRQEGQWDAVDKAFAELPSSTEQTLHPEKYLGETRDNPTPITFPQFDALSDDGWTRVDAAVHGEYYLRVLLKNFDVAQADAETAAAGWDGDLYHAYRNDDDDILVVFASTWDSEQDATEFFDHYRSALENKYDNLEPVDAETTDDRYVFDCGDDLGHGIVQRRGREVFFVEGGSMDVVTQLIDELNDVPIEHVK